MFFFVVKVVVVSILVSLFANWIKLIPRYPKRSHVFLQELVNTILLTIVLTLLLSFGLYLSWFFLSVIIIVVVWLSVRITDKMVRKAVPLSTEHSSEGHEGDGTN